MEIKCSDCNKRATIQPCGDDEVLYSNWPRDRRLIRVLRVDRISTYEALRLNQTRGWLGSTQDSIICFTCQPEPYEDKHKPKRFEGNKSY